MSVTAKATLCGATAISFGIIGYVHYKQQDDNNKLHEGVLRDIERQQRRKIENTYNLQQQMSLTSRLRKELNERESGD